MSNEKPMMVAAFINCFEKIKILKGKIEPQFEQFYKLSNTYYETSYIISGISLIIVYFFYLLSFMLAFMGIDIWYGTSTIIFIIGIILHITITIMQFLNGYTLPETSNYGSIHGGGMVRFLNDLISIFSNIIIILPVIISISLIIAISLIHYGEVTKTITYGFVGALKGFGIAIGSACGLMLLSRFISSKSDILSFFVKVSSAVITLFLTTIIIVFFSGLMHKLISEIYTYELKCDETIDVCPATGSSDNYSSLYQTKIRPFFVFNDMEININDKKNRFWFISLLIHILIVLALLIYFYLIIYTKQFDALIHIRDSLATTVKTFFSKNLAIFISDKQRVQMSPSSSTDYAGISGGSKRKIKSKRR